MPIKDQVFLCRIAERLLDTERRFLTSTFLSEPEHQKSLLIRDEKKRDEYLQSHAFKRFVLAKIMEVSPSSISFYANDFGKPFIATEINKRQVYFNLSHTSGLTALITGDHPSIGIDVESMMRGNDIASLEEIVFHEEELIESKRISDEIEQMNNFYTRWVIKEAILKAVGTGLSIDPKLLLIVKDAKGIFKLKSDIIKNANSFQINYKPMMNWAIAYSSYKSNLNIETTTSLYSYSDCSFNEVS